MNRIIFYGPEDFLQAGKVASALNIPVGGVLFHRFPDGESLVRLLSDVRGKEAIVFYSLHQPDAKFMSLYFFCKLLKESGVASVSLVCPYLPYMRQDKAFHEGEAVTSEYFAQLLSTLIDRLITVDPHLHRRKSLNEIYSVNAQIIHSAPVISDWIAANISNAVLIGPDEESEQWVSGVAKNAGVPYIVLDKKRKGDKEVEISFPDLEKYKSCVPVLLDDIISTGHTMMKTMQHLNYAGMKSSVLIGVHAVFAGNAYEELESFQPSQIVTCNTILHKSNKIDLSSLISKTLSGY